MLASIDFENQAVIAIAYFFKACFRLVCFFFNNNSLTEEVFKRPSNFQSRNWPINFNFSTKRSSWRFIRVWYIAGLIASFINKSVSQSNEYKYSLHSYMFIRLLIISVYFLRQHLYTSTHSMTALPLTLALWQVAVRTLVPWVVQGPL